MIEGNSRRRLQTAARQVRQRLETDKTRATRNRRNEAATEAEQALYAILHIDAPAVELPEPEIPRTRVRPRQQATNWLNRHGLEHLRSQLRLMVSTPEQSVHMRVENRLAKHNATLWVSRYATHLVILTLLVSIGLFGGFKGLTAQAAGNEVAGKFATDSMAEGASEQAAVNHSADGKALAEADLSSSGQLITDAPERVHVYTVEAGDTIQSLAAKFALKPETIMGVNHIIDPDLALSPGQELTIIPIDGMYHVVEDVDSLDRIAELYQVDPQAIVDYKPNQLDPAVGIQTGQTLVIPNGTAPDRDNIYNYESRPGDTLTSVVTKFKLQVQTIKWANPEVANLEPEAELAAHMKLVIPPIDGIVHPVVAGDSIASIATFYGVNPEWLANYGPNHLTAGAELEPGWFIMVPGASEPTPTPIATDTPLPTDTPTDTPVPPTETAEPEMVAEKPTVAPKKTATPNVRVVATTNRTGTRTDEEATGKQPGSSQQPQVRRPEPTDTPRPRPTATPKPKPTPKPKSSLTTGRFIWPADGVITQYFSWKHNGLDIAEPAGSPIYAADGGEVSWAGWRTDGLGYCVIIEHDNGYRTIYGHMRRKPSVYVGQYVERGHYLGPVGSTGRSTGPHLHFMVKRNGSVVNPLKYLP